MKDLETTWSHIVSKKMAKVRDERGMTLMELGERTGIAHPNLSAILSRGRKGSEENFKKIGIGLGLTTASIDSMLHESLLEAIEQEYGVGIAFALKTHFKLSERGVRDAMKFLNDLAKNDKE